MAKKKSATLQVEFLAAWRMLHATKGESKEAIRLRRFGQPKTAGEALALQIWSDRKLRTADGGSPVLELHRQVETSGGEPPPIRDGVRVTGRSLVPSPAQLKTERARAEEMRAQAVALIAFAAHVNDETSFADRADAQLDALAAADNLRSCAVRIDAWCAEVAPLVPALFEPRDRELYERDNLLLKLVDSGLTYRTAAEALRIARVYNWTDIHVDVDGDKKLRVAVQALRDARKVA